MYVKNIVNSQHQTEVSGFEHSMDLCNPNFISVAGQSLEIGLLRAQRLDRGLLFCYDVLSLCIESQRTKVSYLCLLNHLSL